MKKRRLTDFLLTEISGVDNPAQPTAKMSIMKRHVTDSDIKKHAGSSGKLPDGENMSAEELTKAHAAEVAKFQAEVAKTTEEKSELAKKLAEVEAVAKMDDSEKLVYKAMSDKEKSDWLKLSEDEKKKKKEEMSKRDETIVVDGASVSKSVVGDAMFAVLKRQSDLELQVAKANESVEMARLEKRAVEEFGKMAGTPSEIAHVLKSIKTLDETTVKFVEGLMTKENDLAKKASETIGTKQAVEKTDTVEKAVADIMKRDSVTKRVAMETIVKERPELFN